jgi:hypothetical protein
MMKPHDADLLLFEPGGNLAIRMAAIRKQT